jgi:serine/threonine protein kinase/WD40 repeat protein
MTATTNSENQALQGMLQASLTYFEKTTSVLTIAIEHDRRQVEALQRVAHPCLALDGHARRREVRDIAIDRPLAHFEIDRQLGGRHGRGAAQDFYDLKETVGAAHVSKTTVSGSAVANGAEALQRLRYDGSRMSDIGQGTDAPHAEDDSELLRLARVDEIVTEELRLQKPGKSIDISAVARRHPDVAKEIRAALKGAQKITRVAKETEGEREPLPSAIEGFEMVRVLGRGGMGVVVEAQDIKLDRRVAIKVLPRLVSENAEYVARFKREAHAAARLEHPNVIPIFGVGEADGQAYIAMKLVDGHGLDTIVSEIKREESAVRGEVPRSYPAGPGSSSGSGSAATGRRVALQIASERLERPEHGWDPSPSDSSRQGPDDGEPMPIALGATYHRNVAKIGLHVAEALMHAHSQGVLHRDIKPGNILVDRRGHVWVADFGLAKVEESEDVTREGDFVGTLRYMAPEQFQGHAEARSDTYALGLVLYEMLTLERAIKGNDRGALAYSVLHQDPKKPRSIRPQIPDDLEQIVMKACAKLAEERYRSANALALDLRAYLDGRPIAARMPSALYLTRLAVNRNRPLFMAIAVLVGLLLLGVMAYIAELRRASEAEGRLVYRSSLAAASAALKEANIPTARTQLAACPPDQRGWIWDHLSASLDQSITTYPTSDEVLTTLDLVDWNGEERIVVGDRTGLTVLLPDGSKKIEAPFDLEVMGHGVLTSHITETHVIMVSHFGRYVKFPLDESSTEAAVGFEMDGGSEVVDITDDGRFAAAYRGHTVQVVNLDSMEVTLKIPCEDPSIRDIQIAPDGKKAWTASARGRIVEWDLVTGEQKTRIELPTQINRVVVDRDGQRLIAGGVDGAIYVSDTSQQSTPGPPMRQLLGHKDGILSLSIAPNGRKLASTGGDMTVCVWDLDEARLTQSFTGHSRRLHVAAFREDSERIVSAGRAGIVKEWRLGVSAGRDSVQGHYADVVATGFSSDGLRFATGARDAVVRVYDAKTHRTDAVLIGHSTELYDLVWHADGNELTTVDRYGVVINWDVDNAEALWRLNYSGVAISPTYSLDGTTLYFGTNKGQLVTIDAATGAERRLIELPDDGVRSVALSPDGNDLLVGTLNGYLHTVDPDTLEIRESTKRHGTRVSGIAFSPKDGSMLTVGFDHKLVISGGDRFGDSRVLDLGGEGHTWAADALEDIDISPDGRLCAIASHNMLVRVIDLETESLILDLPGHESWVRRVAFSPDGASLVSTGSSAEVLVWDTVGTDERMTALEERLALERAGAALISSQLGRKVESPEDVVEAFAWLRDEPSGHGDLRRAARAYLHGIRDANIEPYWQRELVATRGEPQRFLALGAAAYLDAQQRTEVASGETHLLAALSYFLRGSRVKCILNATYARDAFGDAADDDPVLVAIESMLDDLSIESLDPLKERISTMGPAWEVETALMAIERIREKRVAYQESKEKAKREAAEAAADPDPVEPPK